MLNTGYCIISPSEHKFKGNDVSVTKTFWFLTGSRRKRQKHFSWVKKKNKIEKEVRITSRLEAFCV